MLAQQTYIDRVRALADEDPRIVAALQYGSFSRGEGDRHSDVEFYVFVEDDALSGFDAEAFAAAIAPIQLAFVNEFGTFVVVFERFVRGEFHFEPASTAAALSGWVWEDLDPEAMVLKDPEGVLRTALEEALETPAAESATAEALEQSQRLYNWLLLAANVFARGEYARTLDALGHAHPFLLRGARLTRRDGPARKHQHWLNPTRALETRSGEVLLARYGRCTARLEEASLRRALAECWHWGLEQASGLETELVWRRTMLRHEVVARLLHAED